MGALGGFFGLGGGAAGTGFSGPSSANLMQTVQPWQLSDAQANLSRGLSQQDQLLALLGNQGALGKQDQVYGQLQGIASGTGPNPAQAQFKQNANQIGAQTAGLIGSQKGMSPALQARLIAQQGAGAQQSMAGQNAVALAQQQLGAIGAMGNMANIQAGNLLDQTNTNAAAKLQAQQNLLGAGGNLNNALLGNQSNINNVNQQWGSGVQQQQGQAIGGAFKGASGAAAMADGGMVGPTSSFGKHMAMRGGGYVPGKAAVGGDSSKNDTVPALLSPGEIVLPRSVVNSKKPEDAAARFVATVLARKKAK